MEAKGVVPVDRTGIIDSRASAQLTKLIQQDIENQADIPMASSSYAPFLVSQKSKNLDFQKQLYEAKTAQPFMPVGFKPVTPNPGQFQYKLPPAKSPISPVKAPLSSPFITTQPRPMSNSPIKPFIPQQEADLPYSDL